MLKEDGTKSAASTKENESIKPFKTLDIKEIKTIDFDDSGGFFCDINTGICGPIKKKEEGKE